MLSSASCGSACWARPSLPPRGWRLHLEDILESTEKVDRFTGNLSFENFREDEKTVDAVVRSISIVGEAAGRVPEEIRERYPDVPRLEMRGMRNVVIHEYAPVSIPIVWQTAKRNLPPLVPMLREILDKEA